MGSIPPVIAPPNADVRRAAEAEISAKLKPRGSLGRLEALAVQFAAIRGTANPIVIPAVVICAGDHGVATEGVSAYPQEVTGQMLGVYLSGGAAISVLSAQAGAEVIVIDCGIVGPSPADVRNLRIAPGTANIAIGPAMSREQAEQALANGDMVARELAERAVSVVATGEMGIANSTVASALVAAILGVAPARVVGPGTGLDPEGVARKVAVVERALAANPDRADPIATLAALGGFEIATLAGLILGLAARNVAVLLDGFITSSAALVANAIDPGVREYLIAGHRSPEPGHALVLDALGLSPLLDLGMRLGEGSGAALALPLLRSAVAILADMATFDQRGVSDSGR